jgi:hypothetical protein
MTFCSACGRHTMPDESGLCTACLAEEWRELRQRVNLWDVDGLRARVEDRPLPRPRRTRQTARGRED